MAITVATWNINSVRLRLPLVLDLLREHAPTVLCLQETKCPNDMFPQGDLRKLGYGHIAFSGQKGYNGVAIISRLPFTSVDKRSFCGRDDCRHIAATLSGAPGLTIHNYYVPAGGDIADVVLNPKFAHKMAFLGEMEALADSGRASRRSEIMVGDLNVAPGEFDVWSHKQLLDVVSHTPRETEALDRIRERGGWVDAIRAGRPEPEKVYTWWSYRALEWHLSNRGRRLDHIWLSEDIAQALTGSAIVRDARGWPRPSDHVPVLATLDL